MIAATERVAGQDPVCGQSGISAVGADPKVKMLNLYGMSHLIRHYVSSCSLLFLLVAVQLWSMPSAVAQSCLLRLALDTPFPPHIILDDAAPHGLNVRMLQALATEVGCELQVVKSPWARALKLMRQGQIDVISQLSYNAERGKDLYFIGPHHQERMWLIADPTTQPALQQLADLRHWPASWLLAMLNGGYFGEQFRQLQTDVNFKRHLLPILSNQDELGVAHFGSGASGVGRGICLVLACSATTWSLSTYVVSA